MRVLADVPINDRWLFHYVYPLTAIAVVHIGNENSLIHLLTIPSYYSDLLLAFALSFGVGAYYHWWYKTYSIPGKREGRWLPPFLRYLSGVLLIPVGTIVGVELVYVLLLLDIPFAETSIIYLELPLVLLFCAMVNLVYGMLNYRKKYQYVHFEMTDGKVLGQMAAFQTNFVVHGGTRSKNLAVKEVAYFQVESKLTFLVTHDGRRYLYSSTIKGLENELDPKEFFCLNRQVIAHRRGIRGYEQTGTRKLEIHLSPDSTHTVFVSKAKSALFLRWIDGKLNVDAKPT